MESTYFAAVHHPSYLKDFGYPEVAFIGRSNCGKSSLLNALLNKKKLARTSATPGRTQMIHFYLWNKKILFADLPGYGYTKSSRAISKRWPQLMEAYCDRSQVGCFLCLLDIRREFRPEELTFMTAMEQRGQRYVVVLTKADKLSKNQLKVATEQHKKALASHSLQPYGVHSLSATKKTCLEPLLSTIVKLTLARQ